MIKIKFTRELIIHLLFKRELSLTTLNYVLCFLCCVCCCYCCVRVVLSGLSTVRKKTGTITKLVKQTFFRLPLMHCLHQKLRLSEGHVNFNSTRCHVVSAKYTTTSDDCGLRCSREFLRSSDLTFAEIIEIYLNQLISNKIAIPI